MSENRLSFTLIGSFALIGFMVLCFLYFTAIVRYITIGVSLLALIVLVGAALRKWQHSGLPVKAHKLEQARLAHEKDMDQQRLRMEWERHTHELDLAQQRWQFEQHLLLTRIAPDAKGFYPYLVTQEGGYQHLPNPHLRMKELEAPAAADMPLLEAGGRLPSLVKYDDVKQAIPRGHTLLGINEQEQVVTREYSVLSTCWIVGGSKTGKTNTVALKVQEAYDMGSRFLVIDPHAFKDDSLYNSIRGYAGRFLMPMAQEVEDILPVLHAFIAEFERRKQTGDCPYPITLLVDEVGSLVSDKAENEDEQEVIDLLKKIARICGQEARGFNMFGMFISQDSAGLSWLRKRAMTVIAHKQLMMSERLLACNNDTKLARSMDTWPIGRVLVYGLAFEEIMVLQMAVFSPRRVVDAMPSHSQTGQLREQQAFPDGSSTGNAGNTSVNGRYTSSQAAPLRIVESDVNASRDEASPVQKKENASQVGNEIRRVIVKLHKQGMSLGKIAETVGLNGRYYGLFQEVCKELGIKKVEEA